MFEVVIDAVCGAAGAVIGVVVAKVVARPGTRLGSLNLVIFIGVTVGSMLLLRETAGGPLRAWNNGRQVDAMFAEDPLFTLVLSDYPDLKEPLRASLIEAAESGSGEDAALRARLVGSVFTKYLAKAPDEPVTTFAATLVAHLRRLEARDADACYRFLFPGSASVGSNTASSEPSDQLYAAMLDVVESAHRDPVTQQDEIDEDAALASAQANLVDRYGDDVSVLAKATEHGVDRATVCRMTAALYEELLKLPEQQRGAVLRWLFSR
jgi:hypothetical protein